MQFDRRLFVVFATFVAVAGVPTAQATDLEDVLEELIASPVAAILPSNLSRPEGVNDGTGNTVGTGQQIQEDAVMFGIYQPSSTLAGFSGVALSDLNIPVGSSVAAFSYTFDPQQNVFVRQRDSLGPILSDRADTLGKHKFNFGVNYSHIDFIHFEGDRISNIDLGSDISAAAWVSASGPEDAFNNAEAYFQFPDYNLYAVGFDPSRPTLSQDFVLGYTLPDDDPFVSQCSREDPDFCYYNTPDTGAPPAPGTGSGPFNVFGDGPPGDYFFDVTQPTVNLDLNLKVNSLHAFGSFGITDRIDIGVVVPFHQIKMRARVTTTIPDLSQLNRAQNFDDYRSCLPSDISCVAEAYGGGTSDVPVGIQNQLFNSSFGNTDTLSQDDVTKLLTGHQIMESFDDTDKAHGIGDVVLRGKYNFYRSEWVQVATRADFFFPTGDENNFLGSGEWSSAFHLIASGTYGFFSPHVNAGVHVYYTGPEENHVFRYLVGGDFRVHERATLSLDVIGSQDLVTDGIGDTQVNLAPGAKINPWNNLVLSAAAIVTLNHQGLRPNVVPSFSVEYTF